MKNTVYAVVKFNVTTVAHTCSKTTVAHTCSKSVITIAFDVITATLAYFLIHAATLKASECENGTSTSSLRLYAMYCVLVHGPKVTHCHMDETYKDSFIHSFIHSPKFQRNNRFSVAGTEHVKNHVNSLHSMVTFMCPRNAPTLSDRHIYVP